MGHIRFVALCIFTPPHLILTLVSKAQGTWTPLKPFIRYELLYNFEVIDEVKFMKGYLHRANGNSRIYLIGYFKSWART